MSEWRSIHLTQARQVAALMGVTQELPAPEVGLRARYEELKAADPTQALNFIAHALPRFEAILWAATVVTGTQGPAPSREEHLTRSAIRHWMGVQDDATRRAAHDSAQNLSRDLPERSLASAISTAAARSRRWKPRRCCRCRGWPTGWRRLRSFRRPIAAVTRRG
jgi:hypothetical protein